MKSEYTLETSTQEVSQVLENVSCSMGYISGLRRVIEIVGIANINQKALLDALHICDKRLSNANKDLVEILLGRGNINE